MWSNNHSSNDSGAIWHYKINWSKIVLQQEKQDLEFPELPKMPKKQKQKKNEHVFVRKPIKVQSKTITKNEFEVLQDD